MCDIVAVSIFDLQFFVKLFSKNSIVDYAVFSYGTLFRVSWTYWEGTFYIFRNSNMKFFLKPYPCTYKTLTLQKNFWLLQFCTDIVHQKLFKSNRVWFKRSFLWKLITTPKAMNILYVQSRSTRGLQSPTNFCSKNCTNTYDVLTKYSAPQGEIKSLRFSDVFKLRLNQTQLHNGMHLQ